MLSDILAQKQFVIGSIETFIYNIYVMKYIIGGYNNGR
jgi:hypothetical protein